MRDRVRLGRRSYYETAGCVEPVHPAQIIDNIEFEPARIVGVVAHLLHGGPMIALGDVGKPCGICHEGNGAELETDPRLAPDSIRSREKVRDVARPVRKAGSVSDDQCMNLDRCFGNNVEPAFRIRTIVTFDVRAKPDEGSLEISSPYRQLPSDVSRWETGSVQRSRAPLDPRFGKGLGQNRQFKCRIAPAHDRAGIHESVCVGRSRDRFERDGNRPESIRFGPCDLFGGSSIPVRMEMNDVVHDF